MYFSHYFNNESKMVTIHRKEILGITENCISDRKRYFTHGLQMKCRWSVRQQGYLFVKRGSATHGSNKADGMVRQTQAAAPGPGAA